jgi:hypothetical protein
MAFEILRLCWSNAELLYIEFSNFVQCHILISYLSCYFNNGVLNIRDTITAAEKYSRLCRPINLFIARIYKMDIGK